MSNSQQPAEVRFNMLPNGGHQWAEPTQTQCGMWVEQGENEGFCTMPPTHDGPCVPPSYQFRSDEQ